MQNSIECKLAVIGDNGVGKSSLCEVFVKDKFSSSYNPNEEEFYRQKVRINNLEVTLDILDINFTSPIFQKLVKQADCFLLVYDITNQSSVERLLSLYKEISILKEEKFLPKVLVGNKCDTVDKREVGYDVGLKISMEWGCQFIEVSAKLNTRVAQAFTQCANYLNERSQVNNVKQKQCCCIF